MTRVLTSAGRADSSAVEEESADRTVLGNGGANGNHAAQPTNTRVETRSQFTPGDDDQTYARGRRARLQRGRIVAFSIFVPLWVLSVVPLARETMDGRDSADTVLVYLAVAAIGLGVAALVRGAYILLTKHRFWTPWVFVIAAVVGLVGYAVQSAGEEVVPVAAQTLERSVE